MAEYSASLDVSGIFAAPDRCPWCSGGGIVAGPDDDSTAFRCLDCGQSWLVEFGRVVRVTARMASTATAPREHTA